ncbi:MAG: hypothetical protein BM556_13495 [Bacteriovorax sp. MedPE-SWde]|nr:MAG: hypothetical protein BM556_13495 [Bacteriovorax sp. MedPE-SWde]
MQKDPIGFAGGDTNLYRYVGNDPVNYVDPAGKSATLAGAVAGGFSGLLIGAISGGRNGVWGAFEGAAIGAATGTAAGAAAGLAVDLAPVAAVGYLASGATASIFGFTGGSIANAFSQLAFRGPAGVNGNEILASGVGGSANGILAPVLPVSTAAGTAVGINIEALIFGGKEAVCK